MSDHSSAQTTPEPLNQTVTIRVGLQQELGVLLQQLKDTESSQIRLAIPDRAIVAQGTISLKLLAEEAEQLGKHLEIASDSRQVQTLAKRAGLVLVAGVGAAVVHGFMPGQDAAIQSPDSQLPMSVGVIGPVETVPKPLFDTPTQETDAPSFLKRFHVGKVTIVAVLILLGLGGGGLYLAATYLPRAVVTVYTQERTINRDLTVLADPSATTADAKTLTIPSTEITVDASKSQIFPATGKKDIGEKAKGPVSLFNQTSQNKTLAAGTVLTGNKLQFSLDTAVSVPAATTSVKLDPITFKLTNETTPGKAEGSMTALVLGTEANLPASTQFSVAGYDSSSFLGRNDAALTGGSKQSVTIITADDRQSAIDTVTQDVQDAATVALKAKVQLGQLLLEDAIKQKVTTTTVSNAVGEQVAQFSVIVKVTASAPTVSEADLKAMLNAAVAEKVPDGYTLDKEQSSVENRVVKIEPDGVVKLTSTFKTLILPHVDVNAMRAAIKGKKPQAVEEYLKGQPNLNGYDIKLTPKLPGPFYKLPSIDSNIQIKVQVKK